MFIVGAVVAGIVCRVNRLLADVVVVVNVRKRRCACRNATIVDEEFARSTSSALVSSGAEAFDAIGRAG